MAALRDGSEVVIRRVTSADAPLLAESFERLSRESRELRFLTAKSHLSARELRYLTEVDGHFHEALGALDPATGQGVGVARFARLAPDADVAEVAVTVADAWQQRGLGTLLLEQLTDRARAEGITRYTALVSAENTVVVDLLRRIGAHVREIDPVSEAIEYEIELAASGLGHSLRSALRAVAGGHMLPPKRIVDALSALLSNRLPVVEGEPGRVGGPSRRTPGEEAGLPDADAQLPRWPQRGRDGRRRM
jgi:RimJ/RimL family protein N-acetyltransferase